MNEKRNGLASVRIWWLAIPGGMLILTLFFGIVATMFGVSGMFNFINIRNILRTSGASLLIAGAFAIPFSRGSVNLSVLGVASFCGVLFGVLNNAGVPGFAAALIVMCIGACIGLLTGLIAMIFRRKNVLFTAAITGCISMIFRQISNLICGGIAIKVQLNTHFLRTIGGAFILPLFLLIGIFALVSFTRGGKRSFSEIYKSDEDRSNGAMATLLPYLFSGALAGFAAVLVVGRMSSAVRSMFSFDPGYILPLAMGGIMIPNVKSRKIDAFLGYLSLILAVAAVECMENLAIILGMDSTASFALSSVLCIAFIILNALLGAGASRIECASAPAASPEYFSYTSAANPYAPTGSSYSDGNFK